MIGIRTKAAVGAVVLAVGALTASSAVAGDDDRDSASTELIGFEEVPAVSTSGRGSFRVWIDDNDDEIKYRLSYRKMSSEVVAAHIHFGQQSVNGGVAVFLCSDDPVPGVGACPDEGTVQGTATPADVIGPDGQGIAPGEFDELLAAMRGGVTYANVHSTTFPSGEIRGQIGGDHGHHDRDHDDHDDD